MISCCFFGHREVYEDIDERLEKTLCYLIEKENVSHFYVGNHGTYDSIVKRKLEALKEKYPHISCCVVLAYIPKTYGSHSTIETIYPEGIECVPKRYAINFRNKWMIDQSEYVVSYVKYETGGASKFQTMAERKGKHIINIAKQ